MMTATFKTTKARALGIICVVLAVIIAVILWKPIIIMILQRQELIVNLYRITSQHLKKVC